MTKLEEKKITSKETIIQIAKMIASGKFPNGLYDEYLSECPIGFMGEKELIEFLTQDLERLEILELNLDSEKYHLVNENQCLKNRVEDLEICYKELEKENKELLMALENKNKEIKFLKELIESNPYKTAIKILKDKVSFEIILNLCDDEEKELLKGVLENVK